MRAPGPLLLSRLALLLGLLCGPIAGPVLAGAQAASPAEARRVALFDFEDTNDAGVKLGSGLVLPPSWAAVGRSPSTADPRFASVPVHRAWIERRGHPAHNPVGFATDPTDPGGYVLRLGLLSGDVGAYLAADAVPARPGAVYRVDLRLRPRNVAPASVQVRSFLVDSRGRRLPDTEVQAWAGGPPGRHGWQPWSLQVAAPDGPNADIASLVLEVSLRQPRLRADDPLGDQRVRTVATEGELDIDDVGVWLMPVAKLSTRQPLQITRLPERPEVRFEVQDVDGEGLQARLRAHDLDGHVVDATLQPARVGEQLRWQPSLPKLGWYEVLAEVLDAAGRPLLEHRLAIVHAPAKSSTAAGPTGLPGVSLDLTDLDLPLSELGGMASAVDLPGVVLPAWSPSLSIEGVPDRAAELGSAARELAAAGLGLEVALGPAPASLAAAAPLAGPVLGNPARTWAPWVEPLVVAVGGRANGWWAAPPARLASAPIENVQPHESLARLVGDWAAGAAVRPVVASDQLDDPAGPASSARARILAQSGHVSVATAGHFASDAAATAGTATSPGLLSLRSPVDAAVSERVAAEALATALVDAWVAAPRSRIAIGPLLRVDRGQPEARPTLPVAERISDWVAAASSLVALPVGPDVDAWALPDGAIIARSRGSVRAILEVEAGPGVLVSDVWGNRWRPAPVGVGLGQAPGLSSGLAAGAAPMLGVRVGRLPVRVTGLRPGVVGLQAGFSLDRPAFEAVPGPHPRTVRLQNPLDQPIRGFLRLEAPAGWTVRPARLPVSVPAGGVAELPVSFQFPGNAAGGAAVLRGILEDDTGQGRSVSVRADVELGLAGLRIEAALAPGGPEGSDLVATCVVFNESDRAESLSIFAQASGHPFSERLAPRVEPGGVVVFRFRFPGAARAGGQGAVLCGVRRSGRPGALNVHLRLSEGGS